LALPQYDKLAKYQISSRNWDAMKDIKAVLSVSHKWAIRQDKY